MKKQARWKRALKVVGLLSFLLFVSTLIWANWEPLSPGQKATPIRFVQLDATGKDSVEMRWIEQNLRKQEGIRATAYNPISQILSIGYEVEKGTSSEMIRLISSRFSFDLSLKYFEEEGPKCPMTATRNAMSSLKKSLNFRD